MDWLMNWAQTETAITNLNKYGMAVVFVFLFGSVIFLGSKIRPFGDACDKCVRDYKERKETE
jgi:hypothetical protein